MGTRQAFSLKVNTPFSDLLDTFCDRLIDVRQDTQTFLKACLASSQSPISELFLPQNGNCVHHFPSGCRQTSLTGDPPQALLKLTKEQAKTLQAVQSRSSAKLSDRTGAIVVLQ